MVTLESSKLFGQLPAHELKPLQAVTQQKSFAPGQEIFKEGDPGDGVYVVQSGQVQISAIIGTGERIDFSRVQAGDFFGEMAVLDNQPRSACATAETDTVVFFIPRTDLVGLLTRSPGLCMTLLQEISRRLREFNQQYLREVLMAERMALVGRFASSIVHDLKNPLAIISIAAEMGCTETASNKTRADSQQRIMRQVDRITSMVNDILEFTRGNPNTVVLVPENYATFVQSIIEELRQEAARKYVVVEMPGPPPSLKLPLNPPRLERVFHNLVVNAAEAMPDGGKVFIRFHLTDDVVTTEITDTGRGIAPEILERIFEPFVTHGKPTGTGLGLSICKRIIEEHGGRITARNEPGAGAVFAFSFPLRKAKREA
ncbi:MAG: ATP-binding protein [Acidobacteriota bacterium]